MADLLQQVVFSIPNIMTLGIGRHGQIKLLLQLFVVTNVMSPSPWLVEKEQQWQHQHLSEKCLTSGAQSSLFKEVGGLRKKKLDAEPFHCVAACGCILCLLNEPAGKKMLALRKKRFMHTGPQREHLQLSLTICMTTVRSVDQTLPWKLLYKVDVCNKEIASWYYLSSSFYLPNQSN